MEEPQNKKNEWHANKEELDWLNQAFTKHLT